MARQRQTFFPQGLLPVDDGGEQQRQRFAAGEDVRFTIRKGGQYGKIMLMAQQLNEVFGKG